MKKQTYRIACFSSEKGEYFKEVLATPIMVGNREAFVFKEEDTPLWNVSDMETGMSISREYSKKEAVFTAEWRVEHAYKSIIRSRQAFIDKGFGMPINPLTNTKVQP